MALHTKHPGRLHIHIIHLPSPDDIAMVNNMIHCYNIFEGISTPPKLSLVIFNDSLVQAPIRVVGPKEDIPRLSSPANFARFYFDKMLPGVDKIIYIDADTIVLGDIVRLWDDTDMGGHLIAAVKDAFPMEKLFFRTSFINRLFWEQYNTEFDFSAEGFNAGVYIMDLKLYREENFIDQVHYWMSKQSEHGLWQIATQPLTELISYHNWLMLDKSWNVVGLGNLDNAKVTEEAQADEKLV